jgi:hypothetical protein
MRLEPVNGARQRHFSPVVNGSGISRPTRRRNRELS